MTDRMRYAEPLTPPPPSERLTVEVARARPVRLRDPRREALLIMLFAVGWLVPFWTAMRLRPDLSALPIARYAAGALAWAAVILVGLRAVMLPARGQVLPSVGRARLAALVLPLLAAAAALALLLDAPGRTVHPEGAEALRRLVHCLSIATAVGVAPLAFAIARARARLLVGRGWLGAALGVAMGALGALVLHFACPVGGAVHVVVGHGGALLVGGLVGAGLARLIGR